LVTLLKFIYSSKTRTHRHHPIESRRTKQNRHDNKKEKEKKSILFQTPNVILIPIINISILKKRF
jgi:hypothetical protein